MLTREKKPLTIIMQYDPLWKEEFTTFLREKDSSFSFRTTFTKEDALRLMGVLAEGIDALEGDQGRTSYGEPT